MVCLSNPVDNSQCCAHLSQLKPVWSLSVFWLSVLIISVSASLLLHLCIFWLKCMSLCVLVPVFSVWFFYVFSAQIPVSLSLTLLQPPLQCFFCVPDQACQPSSSGRHYLYVLCLPAVILDKSRFLLSPPCSLNKMVRWGTKSSCLPAGRPPTCLSVEFHRSACWRSAPHIQEGWASVTHVPSAEYQLHTFKRAGLLLHTYKELRMSSTHSAGLRHCYIHSRVQG
jgi:hypothetical protein